MHPHSPPEAWEREDGIRAVAELVAGAAAAARGHGLRIGYHNHHWELAVRLDGRTALERFAELLDPAVVLEVDTYWAAVGGQDVPALLGRLGDRVRPLHLKDGPLDGDTAAQLPLGAGAMPVPRDPRRRDRGCEFAVLEFDEYAGDIFEGIAASYAYARPLGAAMSDDAGPVGGRRRRRREDQRAVPAEHARRSPTSTCGSSPTSTPSGARRAAPTRRRAARRARWSRLLAHDDVEIVVNLTIPAAHAEVAAAALAAGKHVWNEKPIAARPGGRPRRCSRRPTRPACCVGCAPDTFLGPGLQTARRADRARGHRRRR